MKPVTCLWCARGVAVLDGWHSERRYVMRDGERVRICVAAPCPLARAAKKRKPA